MHSKGAVDIGRLQMLNHALLQSARGGDWDRAASLEAERRPLLHRIFGNIAPGSHLQYQALLREMLSADHEVMELVQQRRGELGELLQQVGQGRNALRAYESNR